jgi:Na+/H+ antiporter NhaD/arsenite permease-like protein
MLRARGEHASRLCRCQEVVTAPYSLRPVDTTVVVVFAFVYAGMILGEIPGLALDRSGVALLGAIALIATGRVSLAGAWQAVDVSTMALLIGLMVVSAQFRLGGFYAHLTQRLATRAVPAPVLLALLVGAAGLLSAVLANDIICLAMAPVLTVACIRRGFTPVPFLLALACAANVGSAATLIGNPQNMLIGQRLHLSFAGYLGDAAVPAVLGLAATWGVIVGLTRGRWAWQGTTPEILTRRVDDVALRPLARWQTAKGLIVLAALVVAFLAAPWPRDVVALAGAGVLLLSRRTASRDILGLVDWELLVLFAGLFVVNDALVASGTLGRMMAPLAGAGIDLRAPGALFVGVVALSNLVSNVPAVMLLLPFAHQPGGGAILALASTLAGNLVLVGSIANLIVVEQAARLGVRIGWREHARIGVPVTLVTLGLAAGWLWMRGG